MARDFVFSSGTKYSCINCGRCCTHWGISVDEKTSENLLKYDWGAHYPDMKDKPAMVRRKSAIEGGESYFMKMRKDGRCPFLDDKEFCRIHSDLGYDAKPLTCKRFPLELVKGRRSVYARLSFYCPAVASGEGQALGSQRRWMETCLRGGGTHSLPEEMFWAEGLRLAPADAAEIENHLLDILRSEDRPLRERLLLCGALIEGAGLFVEEKGKNSTGYMREMARLDYQPLEDEAGGKPFSPSQGRLAIGLFLLQDSKPTTMGRLAHLPGIVKYLFHFGGVKSHILKTKSSFRKASKVVFEPLDEEFESLLVRFFEHKIIGKRHLEGDMPLVGTWALFCAAYRVVDIMSRVRAAAEGREKVSQKDVAEALGLADLLVIEHTLLLRMDMTRRMIHSVLSQPGMYKNVLVPL